MKIPFGKKAVSKGISALLSASFVCGMLFPVTAFADTTPDASGFVDELYTAIAGEVPDTPKVTNIKTALENGSITGIEAAHRIVFSTEGFYANRDDADFIDSMKAAANNDLSSMMGLPTFVFLGELNNITREDVFEWYVSTHGFLQLCSDYGIEAGEYGDGKFFDPDAPMLALTFDDGPSPYTDTILDCLEEYGQHATFFVVGDRCATYSSCLTRAVGLGCEIGNHTYDHKNNLANVSGDTIRWEIGACNDAVHDITGIYPTVMRPCGGSYSDTTRANCVLPMII